MKATNHEISEAFFRIGELLSLSGANAFRVRAYNRAAETIEGLPKDLAAVYQAGGLFALKEIPGVGEDISLKIEEMLKTGKLAFMRDLEKQVPSGLLEILSIEGMGPERTRFVWQQFRVKDMKSFEKLLKLDKLLSAKGWGTRSVANITRAIEIHKGFGGRVALPIAWKLAQNMAAALKKSGLCHEVEVAGSVRRMKETVQDIDILVTTNKPTKVADFFVELPEVDEVIGKGPTKTTVRLKGGLHADLRVLRPNEFGAGLYYFTGSKEHNVAVREAAVRDGITISEYGVYRGTKNKKVKLLAAETERKVFHALDMHYIEPELRENRGEVEAALKNKLPHLIKVSDIAGDLHSHSTYSDGVDTMLAMAQAAKDAGLKYLAITDHSSQMGMVKGIKDKTVGEYLKKIAAVREKISGIEILAGTEVDILEDGSLYLSDAALKKLDWVVASVHSNFRQIEEKMTKRIIKAINNPYVRMIGHPTTRLLGKRAPVVFDMASVCKAAKENGVALEVSASPFRLDLDDVHARQAKEAGVLLAISSDAHGVDQFDFTFGVGQARRGWLEKGDVINTMPWGEFQKFLKRKR